MNNKKQQWNYIYNLYNAIISHKYPVSLAHFVTQRCNARCPHCFVDFRTEEKELKLEEIEKIASKTGPCLRNVALTGGEPFIRNDFFEIADIWYQNTPIKSMVITTNGSMPDRINEFCKKASKLDMEMSFFFSYDFIEEKHSEYRRLKDLHLNVIESNKIIKSFGNKFNSTFQITISPSNYESAYETYIYMRDKIKAQNINCTMIRGEKADCLDIETRNHLAEVYKKIQEQKDIDFDNNLISGFNNHSFTASLINAKNRILWKYILQTFVEKKYISPCAAGTLFGIIYHDGAVFPCELRSKGLGYLQNYDYDFVKCWNSKEAQQLKKEIRETKCFCTDECSWLLSIFSSPRYYALLSYYMLHDILRKK